LEKHNLLSGINRIPNLKKQNSPFRNTIRNEKTKLPFPELAQSPIGKTELTSTELIQSPMKKAEFTFPELTQPLTGKILKSIITIIYLYTYNIFIQPELFIHIFIINSQ
jgi:hypothetical protein